VSDSLLPLASVNFACVSEKMAAFSLAAHEKAKVVDDKFKISEKAQQAAAVVRTTATDTYNKAIQNPAVAQSIHKANEFADNVKSKFNDFQSQVSQAIDDKRAERGETGSAPDTSHVAPVVPVSANDVAFEASLSSPAIESTQQQ